MCYLITGEIISIIVEITLEKVFFKSCTSSDVFLTFSYTFCTFV